MSQPERHAKRAKRRDSGCAGQDAGVGMKPSEAFVEEIRHLIEAPRATGGRGMDLVHVYTNFVCAFVDHPRLLQASQFFSLPSPSSGGLWGSWTKRLTGSPPPKRTPNRTSKTARAVFESHLNAVFTQRGEGRMGLEDGHHRCSD